MMSDCSARVPRRSSRKHPDYSTKRSGPTSGLSIALPAGSRAIALFAFLVVPVAVPKRNQVGRVAASLLRELRSMSRAQRAALTELHERTALRDSDPV